MLDITVNYVAVLVAGVANMVVGFLWYGPVFGNTWKGLMGFTDESLKTMKMTPTMAMVGGLISSLIMACVLARFVVLFGAVDVAGALELAFWLWLGFMATVMLGVYLWEGKPFKLFLLNAVEGLVAVSLMTVILALWQ